jgi:predicted dehydrogenase
VRSTVSRRSFLAASAGLVTAPQVLRARGANEKLNVAVIGASNRGAANLAGVAHENVVALCDVDPANAKKAREQFPKAAFFTDYRQLFDKAHKTFDAVVVSTPDHTHAHAACVAMTLGKHVYCEKPLAETVNEVRAMRALAAKHKVVTQMGTQIHAENNYRRVVEIVRAGMLGDIKKVAVWNSSKPVGGKRLNSKPSAQFDLDVWLGPTDTAFFEAEMNKSGWNFAWPHFHWRWWWEFGGGTLADLGCHYIDLPYWALGLTSPTSVRAEGKKTYTGDNTTPDVMRVEMTFPKTKDRGEVELSWDHGITNPMDGSGIKGFNSGVLFVGTKAQLVADYGKYQILPEAAARAFKAPEANIPKSLGHHKEWTEAIKGNGTALCNFAYAGLLTEAVLLGNVAYRAGKDITWDHDKGTTGDAKADAFLSRAFRKGWELPT